MDEHNNLQGYQQPQVITTSVTDKTIKDIGEMIVNTMTTISQIKQQGEVQIAKQEAETAKLDNELYLEQMKSDERITTTLVKWDTYFKGIVLVISFGSIIAIQYLGGSTLTTTIVPVVTFILGSVFKNQINDFIKVRPKKKRQTDLSENADD
jgi:hypothetical protein